VTKPLLIPMPGNEVLADAMARTLGAEIGRLVIRHFPDGESYVRFETALTDRSVALICTLANPDSKLAPLLFAAAAAADLGARHVGLVAPYLAYMRQDRRFQAGEAITSNAFANILSNHFDWLVTVDPHLHRHGALSEIFSIPTRVMHAADAISRWIRNEIKKPLLIGPDAESEQWVAAVARDAEAPYLTLQKLRHGDADVEVSVPNVTSWRGHTPVLVDDIISTGHTMIETIGHLRRAGLPPPVCIGVHGIFAANALDALISSGAARIVTVNTIPHSTNEIDIMPTLAEALDSLAS
jgi:ribose-phosphate pyrophosphokinase